MPNFEQLTVADAVRRTTRPRANPVLQEYREYLARVGPAEAGKLTPLEGETPRTLRVRLTRAARAAGQNLKVVRSGDITYFWREARKRRGRPPKARV